MSSPPPTTIRTSWSRSVERWWRARWSANKIPGVRACLIQDHFAARQGVEDDHMNILCLGGRTIGAELAWDLIQAFLAAEYSQAARHLRRLGKVAALEGGRHAG